MPSLNKDNQLCFAPTYLHWMEENIENIQDYKDRNIDAWSHDFVLHPDFPEVYQGIFVENPALCKIVVEDFMINRKSLDTNRIRCENFMIQEGNEVTVVAGSRGSGKTHEIISTVESIHDRYGNINKVYIGAPNTELEKHGWLIYATVEEIQKDDFGVQDETAVFNSSRDSMTTSNKQALQNLPTIRHVGAAGLAYLVQSTKRMDIGILEYANSIIVKNYTDAMGTNVERKMMSDELILEFMTPKADYAVKGTHVKSWSFVRQSGSFYLKNTPLLSWYTDKVGKAFGRFDNREQGLKFAKVMFEMAEYDVSWMMKYMAIRGIKEDKKFWEGERKKALESKAPQNDNDNLKYPVNEIRKDIKDSKKLLDEDSEQMNYYKRIVKNSKKYSK